MNNSVSIDMSEFNKLKPFFKDQEKIIYTTAVNSFMKGATKAKSIFKKATPSKFKKFTSTIVAKRLKTTNGKIDVLVGYFGRKIYATKPKYNLDAWYILYWSNYGTLKNRASDHTFQSGLRAAVPAKGRAVRKDRTRTRFYTKGGISPLKFFDTAASSALSDGLTAIDEAVEKELNKQVLKYGFK